jgi:hypothetical protein
MRRRPPRRRPRPLESGDHCSRWRPQQSRAQSCPAPAPKPNRASRRPVAGGKHKRKEGAACAPPTDAPLARRINSINGTAREGVGVAGRGAVRILDAPSPSQSQVPAACVCVHAQRGRRPMHDVHAATTMRRAQAQAQARLHERTPPY